MSAILERAAILSGINGKAKWGVAATNVNCRVILDWGENTFASEMEDNCEFRICIKTGAV